MRRARLSCFPARFIPTFSNGGWGGGAREAERARTDRVRREGVGS